MTYDNKTVLITGGTGSFGKAFITMLLKTKVKKIIIYSRDEFKQYNLKKVFNDDRIRWMLGDVRDYNRLCRAMQGVDYVVHAAALKQVDSGEYNPLEFMKTNIDGAVNVSQAAIYADVKKVVALSTDKAVEPINLYGMTKAVSDKTFISANLYGDTQFALVRYGNVAGSRGSVIPFFQSYSGDSLPVTDQKMTRFNITLNQAVETVNFAFENMCGAGETFISKCKSYALVDIVEALNKKYHVIGIRPSEKLHEVMITEHDKTVYDTGKYFIVYPDNDYIKKPSKYLGIKKTNFRYDSLSNSDFFTIEELREELK